MKASDLVPLGDGVYELEGGLNNRNMGPTDLTKLLFGSIETPPPPKLLQDSDVFIPSLLEEDKLMTLIVAYDGSYQDSQGQQQYLNGKILTTLRLMSEGQKVVIMEKEEEEEKKELEEKLLRNPAKGMRIWVLKLVKFYIGPLGLADHTNNCHRGRLLQSKTVSSRSRGPSPIPPEVFKNQARTIMLRLWGIRLCPENEDSIVQTAIEETHRQIPFEYHLLLSLGSWLFQTNPEDSNVWELYQFTFHESLEPERHNLYKELRKRWNELTNKNMELEEVIKLWREMIGLIGEKIKQKLSTEQFSLCDCSIMQPHSYAYLVRSVKLIPTIDKTERKEIAKHIIIASTSLRVFEMIEEEGGVSLHPSWNHHHQVLSDALQKVENNHKLPHNTQDKLRDIILYRTEKLSRASSSNLECFEHLEI